MALDLAPPHSGQLTLPPDRLSTAGLAARATVWAAIAVAAVILPVLSPGRGDDHTQTAITAAIFAMVGLSLNILIGYTGQLSLGHQGFLGAGGLTAAYLTTKSHLPFGVTLLGGLVVGALFALALGFVALRITGLYLSLITLVFGLTLANSLYEVRSLSGGGAGQHADRPSYLAAYNRFYWLCLALLAIVLYLDWRVLKSKTGRALLAIKENERVAAAFGINVTAYKLIGFVLSGAIAGLAGALFAYKTQQFNGNSYGLSLALLFVVIVVVGGAGSRFGVVVAATFFAFLPNLLRLIFKFHPFMVGLKHVPGLNVYYRPNGAYLEDPFIGALLLLLTLIFNPGGIAQQLAPVISWLSGGRFARSEKDSGPRAVEGSSVRA